MNISMREALLSAVSYADIFEYPLTDEELRIWTPFIRRVSTRVVGDVKKTVLRHYPSIQNIETRRSRFLLSKTKWDRAKRVANLLRIIPTVKLVGVTGGLTRSNARQEDDIDLLIITSSKTLWVTRAMATILLDIFHLRRRPDEVNVSDLVCLNMFMSEDGLAVPVNERDLFAAHEVLLMTPLWDRDGVYEAFLKANLWVKKFLPNAWEEKTQNSKLKTQNHNARFKSLIVFRFLDIVLHFEICVLRLFEMPSKLVQLRYMNKHRTTEVIRDTIIRFHPHDARVWIKRKFWAKLVRYNIPLDKIFYGR
ncbi:hypothetical protein HY949_04710 [Candidatus Gottesmanbacteria bacterium]|nr:hypothetical protein [Candidatus Gottesmanbacteria bacterium]